MSIGPLSAALNLSAKLVVMLLYSVRTSQVQQVIAAFAIALLPLMSQAAEPQPGTLIPAHAFAKTELFADWEFAKKVWWELDTRSAFDAEWEKYAPEFEAWLVDLRANPYKARKALAAYPADKRQRILRGYDMQLAYDDWWNHLYRPWRRDYQTDLEFGRALSFPGLLQNRMAGGYDGTQNWISDSGGPDWRTAAMRADDEAMMARAADELAKRWANSTYKPPGLRK